ncbi:methionyl-tRNA formyltransferase [Patescibacteria group bacterium]|nr:methionyl-tRNA formyltransferase [Patescibacteria group bacterium]
MSKTKTTTSNLKINIIFFGNTKHSEIGAKIVNTIFPISLFVTISDSPIALLAKKLGKPSIETKILEKTTIEEIAKYEPDFLVVEDYGLILPNILLKLPRIASLNIHHSLLPKYRGPSPAPAAILNGDLVSGVSIIQIITTVDAGSILAQKKYPLIPGETTDSLLTKLNDMGGKLMVSVIKQYLKHSIKPIPQDLKKATYTKHLTREDGYFNISNPPSPEILDRMIRAYYPWPGAWTRFRPLGSNGQAKIVKFYPGGMIQMEGKKVIPMQDFLNGYPDFPLKKSITLDK